MAEVSGPLRNQARCLLGMLGTDVHTMAIRTIARLLPDSGIDVTYIGEHNSVESMAKAAAESDVDVVGVSFSSSAYLEYTRQLIDAMARHGADHIPLMVGGIIHPDDVPVLRALGVQGIFGVGSSMSEIISFIHLSSEARRRRTA